MLLKRTQHDHSLNNVDITISIYKNQELNNTSKDFGESCSQSVFRLYMLVVHTYILQMVSVKPSVAMYYVAN